jgi:PhzF family phenazine biosynthesis protein
MRPVALAARPAAPPRAARSSAARYALPPKPMRERRYRLLNVFALEGERLSGNPLCVFEDARDLDAASMQALALQFNLSETTFVLPSERATARVRVFTPTFEMPFAGHPTLGTAHVVRDLRNAGDAVTLELPAGVIPLTAEGDRWTLQANPPRWRQVEASRAELAAMLGLAPRDLAGEPCWIDTGSEQLVIPLASAECVARASPDADRLERHAYNRGRQACLVYVFAETGAGDVAARFFFLKGRSVVEDPATGSACANLGGWFVARGAGTSLERSIRQGDRVGRPSALRLRVSAEGRSFVTGLVVELGCGVVRL